MPRRTTEELRELAGCKLCDGPSLEFARAVSDGKKRKEPIQHSEAAEERPLRVQLRPNSVEDP